MGRSKFPGKPSKHVNRKRINVLPATTDTFIECSQSLTVETAVENKQILSECVVDDNANIKNTVNISKVSLRKRLNKKLQNSKNLLNSSSSKRSLISKICNKTNNRTGRQTNINRKSLHGYSMKNINKQQRNNNNNNNNNNSVPKETNNSIVGKFVLPTRSVHSSRVIKPNKRFINVDLSDTLTFKKKTVNNKQNCEKSDDDNKQSTSDNKTNSISEKTATTSTTTTPACIASSSSSSSSSNSSSSSSRCNTAASTPSSTTKTLPNGRIVLRQARLKLHSQTTISNSDGPFSSNLTNNSPPGTVTCGVCGAVRFYRFVKQARKFNIYSCESCRKFISKMIKRQNCGKNNTSNNILVCHEGQGICHVPPVVRNQQMKVVRCGYKARCPACWLKMCLRSFQMPMSLKHSLAQLLPKYMQGSDVMFSNSLPLLWQISNKNLNNQLTNDNIDTNQNDNINKRPVRIKNTTTTTTTTLQSLQQINADIKRQKIDLKGPRVKHVCRSASIVLGQPQATFPIEIDKNKNDNKEQKKIDIKTIICSEETKIPIKSNNNNNKNDQNSSENESSDSDKNSTKLQFIVNDNIINFKRDNFKLPLQNKIENEKKRIHHPEIQSNMVCFDYYDNYDINDINHNGFCLISSQQFSISGICFLCGSSGRETLLYCSLCCEPYHPYCLEQLPFISNNNNSNNNNNNNRQFIWLCPKCTKCTLCNQSERQKINCQMCAKTYHPECLDIKWNGNNPRSNICFECLTCKNCKNQITNLNGNLQFCVACLKIRKESNICTLCLDTFKEDVDELIMECTNCHKWVHVKCEGLSEEYFQILTLLPEKLRYICRLCSKEITPNWRKMVDIELNFNFNQIIRLLSKNKIAKNLLKTTNPYYKQYNINKLTKKFNDNNIDIDHIDDIDDGIANLENININNDNNNKNCQIQCNYELENPINSLTIQDIRNKLNSNQYNSLKEFDDDMDIVLDKINSIDLIKIYKSILNSVFPWYNKQSRNLTTEIKFPIQKQHVLIDIIPNFDNNYQQIDNIIDTRYCQLCRNLGDGYSESRLLYCGQNQWIHINCAFWSDEVYEEIDGTLQNINNAINRGYITRCTYCKQNGATISCYYKNCLECYHFICAKNSNCTFMNDKKIYCLNHLQLFKTNNQITNFQLNRTIFIEFTNNNNDKYYPIDKLNIMIGSLRVLNIGKINPLVSDNIDDVLIPIGYVCTHLYWSTIEPWKLINYKITTSIINCNTNCSNNIDRNFTIDHTLSRQLIERKLKEIHIWQKDIDRKRTDLINDFVVVDDDDEPQNGAADLLSPEITDAIFEELPHELLDGISVQDIFPKLMTNYEDFVSNDTTINNKLIDNNISNNNDNNDNFNDFNDTNTTTTKNQRSCSLTLSCKLDNTFSPAIKKRKIAPSRENNLFFQLLQVDGTFDDSGSSDCESPIDNIDDTTIITTTPTTTAAAATTTTTTKTTTIWNNCNIEEPVTCERCHCTYRTKASYKRHLDSCELICSSESDSELNQEQDNCINIDTTLHNSHLNIMEKCSTVVINETTQQPVVLTTSFESYQNEIHTSVLNTHQTFVSAKSAELIATIPHNNTNNNTTTITNNNNNSNIFISPIIPQNSIDSNQQQQQNETFTTVNRCSTLSVNESLPLQNNQQFCLNPTTVPICVNPSSLTLQSNSTLSVNSPIINQNNQLINQTSHLEYQPSVTIQPVCYTNNLQPIINVTPQNQINFTNNKLISSNSIVTQGININMNQSNRWTKPIGKPTVFTKSQQKLKNIKGRTIIAKRQIDDIIDNNTIIIPTTSSITTQSLTLTSSSASVSSSSSSSSTTSSSSSSQPTMIVQHLPSTTNFIPTFVDTFQHNHNNHNNNHHNQNNQNLQYLTTITTPQINPQPLVQLQTDNNIISLLPGIQPTTTMIIQQQPQRILENQFVLDSNGSLSWAPQQITTQPIYYGFETIVQNTIMQSQQFLPTTVPGVLTANSSYSTTTQVFQTSKLEPVIADVTANSFVLLNPGQLMNQSIQVSSQNTTQHYQQQQPQPTSQNNHNINNNNNNNLNSFIQNKNITATTTTVTTSTITTTTTTTTTATTKLSTCPVKYNNTNNTTTSTATTTTTTATSAAATTTSTTTTNNNNNNNNNNNKIIIQKFENSTIQPYINNNNNTNITLPTSPFISDHGIPTNIVTPTPKLNNNNNINIIINNNNTNQNRPMSRVLPMQSIKETNSIITNNNKNNITTTTSTTTITTTITTSNTVAATTTMTTINANINNNNNNHSNNNNNCNSNSNNNNIINNNNNNNKTDTINKLIKDMKSVEAKTKSIDKIVLNNDKPIRINDEITKSEPIKMIFHKQTEDGTYKICNLFDKSNNIDNEKLDNFVTKLNNSSNNNINNNNNVSNNINSNSPENTFKLLNFTKNSPVAPLKPIKSNCTSQILPLCDKSQNCVSIDSNIDKKSDILSKKQQQQQQDKKDENSPTILYTIETQDGFKYSSTSVTDMWTKLFESVQNARIANNMPPLPSYYNNINNNLKLLGLKSPAIKYLIEQLPGVNKCTKYKPIYNFSSKLNDIDDEHIGHNYGCARCVPHIKPNNNNYDMFGWLASIYRSPEPNLNCTDLVPRRSSINNLPIAMKFRQLKSTSKYSVGVYRSKIHRRGLFCLRDFEAGEMVIEYAGEVIRSILTDKREKYYNSKGIGCYMFRIDDNLVVDATMKGNAARFINHSCDPNCYSKVVEILGHKHIIIFALRRIICGEELTYDYKFPIEEDKIPCTCGTKKCRKFLN